MYAILVTGGKQYKVSEGDVIYVEKLGVEDGATVTFDQVLAVGDGAELKVGAPYVEGAAVTATADQDRQAEEDQYLQDEAEEGLPPSSGSSPALHQGNDQRDQGVNDKGRFSPR